MSSFDMDGVQYPGFSGLGQDRNKKQSACLKGVGPIPPGTYHIVDRPTGGTLGAILDWLGNKGDWFALDADDGSVDDETLCSQLGLVVSIFGGLALAKIFDRWPDLFPGLLKSLGNFLVSLSGVPSAESSANIETCLRHACFDVHVGHGCCPGHGVVFQNRPPPGRLTLRSNRISWHGPTVR